MNLYKLTIHSDKQVPYEVYVVTTDVDSALIRVSNRYKMERNKDLSSYVKLVELVAVSSTEEGDVGPAPLMFAIDLAPTKSSKNTYGKLRLLEKDKDKNG